MSTDKATVFVETPAFKAEVICFSELPGLKVMGAMTIQDENLRNFEIMKLFRECITTEAKKKKFDELTMSELTDVLTSYFNNPATTAVWEKFA